MRRQILTTMGVAAIGMASYAATFMQVVTKDGEKVVYEVDNVSEVNFFDEIIPQDSIIPNDTISSYRTYVDLGLPSGTLWATCNIGATKPEEYGDYFAWAETKPKDVYDDKTYKYKEFYEDGSSSFTKYTIDIMSGTTDSLSVLLPEDDAATVNWGKEWRMPTSEEQKELLEECYVVCKGNMQGLIGIIVYQAKNEEDKGKVIYSWQSPSSEYSSSDPHIFFPAAGCRTNSYLDSNGKNGFYWSSTRDRFSQGYALMLDFNEKKASWEWEHTRYIGNTVRAVRVKE